MFTDNLTQQDVLHLRARAQRIHDSEFLSLRTEQRVIPYWKSNCPKMYQQLKELDALEDMAVVLQFEMWQAVDEYKKAGIPHTEAIERAAQEWLQMEGRHS